MFYNYTITKNELEQLNRNGHIILADIRNDDCEMCSNEFDIEIQLNVEGV